MNIPNLHNNNNNYIFTSRCPQIYDADWVSRKVNSFPRKSVTKYRKQLLDMAVSRGILAQGQSVHYINKLKPEGKRNNLFLRFYRGYKKIVEEFTSIRQSWEGTELKHAQITERLIDQYKYCGMANCGEDAFLAGAIMKLNYFKNVYTACFTKNDKLIGHQVCIFNKDGSEFEGEIKPFNTIIIDPWLQKTDFANLLLKDYKVYLRNFINFDDIGDIEFSKKYITKMNFTDMETYILRIKYPELTHPYSGRIFMHNFNEEKRP